MFSTQSKTEMINLDTLYLWSANAFKLVEPKIFLFGKELYKWQNFILAEIDKKKKKNWRVENIVGYRENAGYDEMISKIGFKHKYKLIKKKFRCKLCNQ